MTRHDLLDIDTIDTPDYLDLNLDDGGVLRLVAFPPQYQPHISI